jgi:hypothetical protein
MTKKFALKRLTASDLTLFKWHFQNHPAGKQKAFNLDAKVLVGDLFPQLGEPSQVPQPRFPIDLYLSGPGRATAYNLQRKILKQEKNWRLNGELIDSPEDDPDRYNSLMPGDYALLEFSGDLVPDTARVQLIAQNVSIDVALHLEISRKYPDGSMWLLGDAEIAQMIEVASPPEDHPIREWVEAEAIEDAVQGGASGVRRIAARRGGKGLAPQEFVRARRAAEQTGIIGEQLLNSYLEDQRSGGAILDFEWSSSINAISPFDFTITKSSTQRRLVDAKSTFGGFSNPIHMSLSELRQAVEGPDEYDIYRIFEVGTAARMRIAENVGPALRNVLIAALEMPPGVTVDSVSIAPSFLSFNDEEISLDEVELVGKSAVS